MNNLANSVHSANGGKGWRCNYTQLIGAINSWGLMTGKLTDRIVSHNEHLFNFNTNLERRYMQT